MTGGFGGLPVADEPGPDDYDESRWSGVSKILGPRWAHLPAVTVGLLGVQIFWSVEMSYGAHKSTCVRRSTVSLVPACSVAIFALIGPDQE